MEPHKREFAALVRATLNFLQPGWDAAPSKPVAAPLPQPRPQPKPEKKETPPLWKLSLPPTSGTPSTRFSKFFEPKREKTSICFFAHEQTGEHRLFLENVVRATTQHIAPVELSHAPLEQILEKQAFHLLVAPISLLKKKFPEVQSHQFLQAGAQWLLPMEPIDSYLADVDLKRVLWNQLKLFPNMLQSS